MPSIALLRKKREKNAAPGARGPFAVGAGSENWSFRRTQFPPRAFFGGNRFVVAVVGGERHHPRRVFLAEFDLLQALFWWLEFLRGRRNAPNGALLPHSSGSREEPWWHGFGRSKELRREVRDGWGFAKNFVVLGKVLADSGRVFCIHLEDGLRKCSWNAPRCCGRNSIMCRNCHMF